MEGDGKGQKEEKSGVSPGAMNAREEKKKSESELEERKLPEKHDKDCEPGIDNESVV